MTEYSYDTTATRPRTDIAVLGWALLAGLILGVVAKGLGLFGEPATMLGQGAAFWVTAGFLIARRASHGRGLLDGTVWAGSTTAVYLGTWLLAYSAVYGLQDPGGFAAAWLNERVFFVLIPPASAFLGLVAAASWRDDWLGDTALAAPIAWGLPEAGLAVATGWQFAMVVAFPSILIGAMPLLSRRERPVNRAVFASACIAGSGAALLLLRVVMDRW